MKTILDHIAYEKQQCAKALQQSSLDAFSEPLLNSFDEAWGAVLQHGDFKRWHQAFKILSTLTPSCINLNTDCLKIGCATDAIEQQAIKEALLLLHPWRKGPFSLFGIDIDTEWRSDMKWRRIYPHLSPLKNRRVLDVGCGSGYHLWRMAAEHASLCIGIDLVPLFATQFAAIKQHLPHIPAYFFPIGIDDMPEDMHCFDSVFSMGVLYHRRSPMDHLRQLYALLSSGGELILETLIVEGDEQTCLLPSGRYAKMRNTWFIPSVAMLMIWLARTGFKNIRCVDISLTSGQEQRATEWMHFESLRDFLDPNDPTKTIEGYPAPRRATLIAEKA